VWAFATAEIETSIARDRQKFKNQVRNFRSIQQLRLLVAIAIATRLFAIAKKRKNQKLKNMAIVAKSDVLEADRSHDNIETKSEESLDLGPEVAKEMKSAESLDPEVAKENAGMNAVTRVVVQIMTKSGGIEAVVGIVEKGGDISSTVKKGTGMKKVRGGLLKNH